MDYLKSYKNIVVYLDHEKKIKEINMSVDKDSILMVDNESYIIINDKYKNTTKINVKPTDKIEIISPIHNNINLIYKDGQQ